MVDAPQSDSTQFQCVLRCKLLTWLKLSRIPAGLCRAEQKKSDIGSVRSSSPMALVTIKHVLANRYQVSA